MTQGQLSFFFPTRNRPQLVKKCLSNICEFHPDCEIWVGNSSSPELIDKTSEVIENFPNCHDIRYDEDPGASFVYNDLFMQYVDTNYCVWLADDIVLLKDLSSLSQHMESNTEVNLIGLPMIDEVPPSLSSLNFWKPWPADKHGCATWIEDDIRCAHHGMLRTSFFRGTGVASPAPFEGNVDKFCHGVCSTNKDTLYWPSDGAYLHHIRRLDDTRIDTRMWGEKFRLTQEQRKQFIAARDK